MRDAVVSVYENRKNLALTLKDTRTVVGKLENILGVGIHGVCFLFYLSIFNVGSCILPLMSLLLLLLLLFLLLLVTVLLLLLLAPVGLLLGVWCTSKGLYACSAVYAHALSSVQDLAPGQPGIILRFSLC